jgi:hypothetical protein
MAAHRDLNKAAKAYRSLLSRFDRGVDTAKYKLHILHIEAARSELEALPKQ